MVSNDEAGIAEAAAELGARHGVRAIPLCMDLSLADSAQRLFDHCLDNGLEVEILVNNAGVFFFGDVVDIPDERANGMIALHMTTPAALSRLFARRMIARKTKGYILNVGSISSRMMMPGIAFYAATKSFMRVFSRAMRNEVFDDGVSVTTLCPGAVATGLYSLPPRFLKAGVRLGAIMLPERVARLAVRKMFARKAECVPGAFFNRLFILVVAAAPEAAVRWLRRKVNASARNADLS